MAEYSMSELVRLTGLADRTIRKYMQRGLVPRSTYRGVKTRYDREQLAALLAVKALTAETNSIADAKRALAEFSTEELEAYASEVLAPPPAPVTEAAAPVVVAPPLQAPPPPPVEVPAAPALAEAVARVPAPSPLAASMDAPPSSERWTRTVLLPGMELSVSDDAREVVKTIAREIRAKYGMT